MSERESDFEFDFFEEPETQETAGRDRTLRRPLGGRGPRGPRGPIRPRAGFTPLLRLLGLIAFAILIVVLLMPLGAVLPGGQEARRVRATT